MTITELQTAIEKKAAAVDYSQRVYNRFGTGCAFLTADKVKLSEMQEELRIRLGEPTDMENWDFG